jgi:hypothetical protein
MLTKGPRETFQNRVNSTCVSHLADSGAGDVVSSVGTHLCMREQGGGGQGASNLFLSRCGTHRSRGRRTPWCSASKLAVQSTHCCSEQGWLQ